MSEHFEISRLGARVQAGDAESFRELYMRYYDRIQVYMDVMLRNEAAADAATEETFRRVLSDISDYRPGYCSFDAWICRLMRRAANRRLGWSGDATGEAIPTASPDASVEVDEPRHGLASVTDHDIMREVVRLSLREREIVILHYMFGLEIGELAAVVGGDVGDVRARHQNALGRLNAMLSRASGAVPVAHRTRPI